MGDGGSHFEIPTLETQGEVRSKGLKQACDCIVSSRSARTIETVTLFVLLFCLKTRFLCETALLELTLQT